MRSIIAYAERSDLFSSDWSIILVIVAIIVVVALLTLAPIALARNRFHRHSQTMALAALAWGFLTGGVTILNAIAQYRWSKERELLLPSGYLDPADTTGAPSWPWLAWGILGIVYGVLVMHSLVGKRPPRDG